MEIDRCLDPATSLPTNLAHPFALYRRSIDPQLGVLRGMQLARPRVTILLIHGEMGSPVAMTRLGYRHVKTSLLLLSDYDPMLSSTVVAELWRTHQEYKPTPVVVNGVVCECRWGLFHTVHSVARGGSVWIALYQPPSSSSRSLLLRYQPPTLLPSFAALAMQPHYCTTL